MWLESARDARGSANELMELERFRSCMSRAYYAVYSKVTHELVVTAGLTMPPDREGPSVAIESRDAREAITLMKTIFDSF
jgi:hypothetical protein